MKTIECVNVFCAGSVIGLAIHGSDESLIMSPYMAKKIAKQLRSCVKYVKSATDNQYKPYASRKLIDKMTETN